MDMDVDRKPAKRIKEGQDVIKKRMIWAAECWTDVRGWRLEVRQRKTREGKTIMALEFSQKWKFCHQEEEAS